VINQDTDRIKKQIWTDNNIGEKVELHVEATLDDEAKYISNKIKYFTSKGIKYENLVIPHDKTNSIAEEIRLLVVAMTREKIQLFLSYCRIVMIFGKKEMVAISRFLENLPVDSVQKILTRITIKK
jgi:superfamily I DNA/RNA helicase